MTRSARKRLLVSGALVLAVGGLGSAAHHWNLFSTAQARSTDFLFKSRAAEQARSTVIVGIDHRTYRDLLPKHGAMSYWPRTLFTHAIDHLRGAGARVIVFDIFFDAPKPEDPAVAAAMKRAGNVIMPVEAQDPGSLDAGPGVAQEFHVFFRPTDTVARAAAAEGLVNVTTDPDTIVRGVPLLLRAGNEALPAMALAAVARYIRRPAVLDAPPGETVVYGAGRAVPIMRHGSMLINFLGPPSSPDLGGPFTIIPFVDVLENSFNKMLVQDKIVLIGMTISGLDELSVPTSATTRMWGVEVLGNAIETVLGERYLVPVSPAVTDGLIFLLAMLATLLGWTRRPFLAAGGIAGLYGAYFLVAGVLFDAGTVLNLIFPPSAILLAFAATLVYRVVFEQAEQRTIRGVMARYLSPSVSQWVLRDTDRLSLGGQTRDMTVFFCDLRGFTTFAQTLDPQVLVTLLNEYMTAMTEIVFRHDGVLDKYIGDNIMAFWNAPMDQPDHARRACETALDMIDKLREIQADWERRGIPKLDMGIGVNTGPMVVGNMGSRNRLAYTVMGDTVNVAARLEGLNKQYGTRVVIGEAAKDAAGGAFVYRFLDVVAVKGRSRPLAVYEIVGRAGQLAPAVTKRLALYQEGIALYRTRRWAEAAALFREILADAKDDGPSALYLRRSSEFLVSPPPDAWDGVYVAQSK